MVAVDTNVLVRLFVRDDDKQFRQAYRCFEQDEIFLSDTVLMETEWVLRFAYRFDRDAIGAALRKVLGLPNVMLADPKKVDLALQWHAAGFDFADALHVAGSQHAEAFATFDLRLIKKAEQIGRCPVREP